MDSGLPMKSSMRKLPRNFKSWFSGWGLNSLPSSFLSSLSTKITQWTSWLEEIHIASFWINTLIRIWRWPRQPWIGKSFYVLACNCSCIIPNCGRQRTSCVLGNLLAELQRLPHELCNLWLEVGFQQLHQMLVSTTGESCGSYTT